jgi:hypothetical protein
MGCSGGPPEIGEPEPRQGASRCLRNFDWDMAPLDGVETKSVGKRIYEAMIFAHAMFSSFSEVAWSPLAWQLAAAADQELNRPTGRSIRCTLLMTRKHWDAYGQ